MMSYRISTNDGNSFHQNGVLHAIINQKPDRRRDEDDRDVCKRQGYRLIDDFVADDDKHIL